METNVAYVKNGIVKNILLFDDPTQEGVDLFLDQQSSSVAIICNDGQQAYIGGTWDGETFLPSRPFASWVLNDAGNEYVPPFLPEGNINAYSWNEGTRSWDQISEDIIALPADDLI
jgi:hypothetical protein